jgi:aryl-alcohol dehydrogenase-like predicted oxidoreductase
MERRTLGPNGFEVPVVGMGTSRTFDVRGRAAEATSRRIVEEALDAGANLFDSSPMYGEAERVLGLALDGRRSEAIVATKVWTSDDRQAERQIETSLRHAHGRVELYQIHNLVAWPARLERLTRLHGEGLVDVVGATHYEPAAFDELMTVMRTGRIGFVQIPYNPLERDVERSVLPLAEDLGLGVMLMRPFGRGSVLRRWPSPADLAPVDPRHLPPRPHDRERHRRQPPMVRPRRARPGHPPGHPFLAEEGIGCPLGRAHDRGPGSRYPGWFGLACLGRAASPRPPF